MNYLASSFLFWGFEFLVFGGETEMSTRVRGVRNVERGRRKHFVV